MGFKISNISERLKSIMHENNFRQIDIVNKCQPFCQKYGVRLGRNDLSQYVSGKVEPSQEKLTVLSEALNVNIVWLMGYDVPKEKTICITKDHLEIGNDVLRAINVLAKESNYNLNIHANSYQIESQDVIVKLSEKELTDYATSSIEQIRYITENIISNKYRNNITSIKSDINVQAAHNDFANDDEEQKLIEEDLKDLENLED